MTDHRDPADPDWNDLDGAIDRALHDRAARIIAKHYDHERTDALRDRIRAQITQTASPGSDAADATAPLALASTQANSRSGRRAPGRVTSALLAAAAVIALGLTLTLIHHVTSGGTTHPTPAGDLPTQRNAPTTTPARPVASYTGPGGISVGAPPGWTKDDSSSVRTLAEYVEKGHSRTDSAYFRIGIGNTNPAETIQQESQAAISYIRRKSTYTRVKIISHVFSTVQGVPATEIEGLGEDPNNSSRHFEELLWIINGATYEIGLNTPAKQWAAYKPVYQELITSVIVR